MRKNWAEKPWKKGQTMAYQIEYAYACHMGKVRNNNEDNFWCCGETLDAENQGIDNIRTGCVSQSELPLLAVFDGMGGESCGEVASYLAAQSCGEFYRKNKRKLRDDPQHFLEEACMEMNRAVCGYSRENKIQSMGTTAALLAFGRNGVFGCNLGDSRIYQSRNGQFRQISRDHVLGGVLFRKAPLIQFVGIPEDSMKLEPSIVREENTVGVRYLICSDGITDMLADGEIADILAREVTVEETVGILLDRALKKGGRDNATIILCEIKEGEKNCFRRVLSRLRQKYGGDAA